MRKAKKRKPDLRRIRPSKTYSLPQIAETLDRDIATVRAWIRDGLPTLGDQKPLLVLGSELKPWLKAKWAARKQPCKPDEMLCFKCDKPRRPETGSVRIEPRNEKTVSITGRCSVCGTRMAKAGSRAQMAEIEETFRALSLQKQRLVVCSHANAKPTPGCASVKTPCYPNGAVQLSMNLDGETGNENRQQRLPAIRLPERKG